MGNCPIQDRELCKFLGSEGCEKCGINQLGRKQDPVAYADTWDVTLSLIPDDIDEVHTTEECCFCKGKKNAKAGYEMLCLKHKEPVHMKGIFFGFGMKVPGEVGSIVDIPIAVCQKCRRTFRPAEKADRRKASRNDKIYRYGDALQHRCSYHRRSCDPYRGSCRGQQYCNEA